MVWVLETERSKALLKLNTFCPRVGPGLTVDAINASTELSAHCCWAALPQAQQPAPGYSEWETNIKLWLIKALYKCRWVSAARRNNSSSLRTGITCILKSIWKKNAPWLKKEKKTKQTLPNKQRSHAYLLLCSLDHDYILGKAKEFLAWFGQLEKDQVSCLLNTILPSFSVKH